MGNATNVVRYNWDASQATTPRLASSGVNLPLQETQREPTRRQRAYLFLVSLILGWFLARRGALLHARRNAPLRRWYPYPHLTLAAPPALC